MIRLAFLLTLYILLQPLHSLAQGYFEWTTTARAAYDKTMQLRLVEASELLEQMKIAEPNNLLRLHVADYIDFLTVYIDEDETTFQQLEAQKNQRLEQISRQGDSNSPYYLYVQADIHLHWALARLKFEEYATTFFETNKAFKLLNKNSRKFPEFAANQKDLGLLHAIVGTIPDNYRWALSWISSMEGTVAQGKAELEEVLTYARHNDFVFTAEAEVFYAYLQLHLENEPQAAWKTIQNSQLQPDSSPLHTFIIANIATYAARNDHAIQLLENAPKGSHFHPFPYLNFMLGEAKLNRLDTDADQHFKQFLSAYKGRNFIKDAYRRLSWHALLFGTVGQFRQYQADVRSRGYTIVGEDESAQLEASEQLMPHQDLLRARLLFDGGYYERAHDLLATQSVLEFDTERHQLEFHYRTGRIHHARAQYDAALRAYQQTIVRGRTSPHYYACRAALEQGRIYEATNQRTAARAAYKNCLSIQPKEHRTGLHQQAKTGLLRLK
ncbi:MAG: hypothetical protein AAGK47_02955 [Bacteroidota bacterium]